MKSAPTVRVIGAPITLHHFTVAMPVNGVGTIAAPKAGPG
jgi:hypothetical protein